jgi:hypothetical protein
MQHATASVKPREIPGFLIDPETRSIKAVIYDGDYQTIAPMLGCELFQPVVFDPEDEEGGVSNDVYVDEESLMKGEVPRYWFGINGYPHQPLAGKGLVLGLDTSNGETVGTTLSLAQLKRNLFFMEFERHRVTKRPGFRVYLDDDGMNIWINQDALPMAARFYR